MKTIVTKAAMLVIVAIALNTVLWTDSAQAQDWPEVFEPNQLLTLNIQTVNPSD